MSIKQIKPHNSSSRFRSIIDKKNLWKGKPYKNLTCGIKKISGRGNDGCITVRRRGGGNKRLYRFIDFKPSFFDVCGIVERVEYDPNRSSFISLINYDGIRRYELTTDLFKIGKKIFHHSSSGDLDNGSSMILRYIPIGTNIYNIEIKPGKGGQIIRSAGSTSVLLGKDEKYASVRLKSGEVRKFLLECRAYIGTVSNSEHQNISLGKAGMSRLLGKRPSVRGVAMNPVDHPHGGGQGKTSGGRHPVTPWGKPTKGKKTRKKINKLIISRRK